MSKRWSDIVDSIRLEPLFPIGQFTPASHCPHKRRIARGSIFVCMVCHQSGKDHLPLPGLKPGSKMKPNYVPEVHPTVYVAPLKAPTATAKRPKQVKQCLRKYPNEPSNN